MPRWRLTAAHYLTVPGTKYRYEEIDRETGEKNVAEFDVPRFLDPKNPRDCRSAGDCVVCHGTPTIRGDWPFLGDPTPDMEPLDEEAAAITEARRPFWSHPIEGLEGNGGFNQAALLEGLTRSLEKAMSRGETIQPTPTGVSAEDFRALQEQVAALMAQNAELKAAKGVARRA